MSRQIINLDSFVVLGINTRIVDKMVHRAQHISGYAARHCIKCFAKSKFNNVNLWTDYLAPEFNEHQGLLLVLCM